MAVRSNGQAAEQQKDMARSNIDDGSRTSKQQQPPTNQQQSFDQSQASMSKQASQHRDEVQRPFTTKNQHDFNKEFKMDSQDKNSKRADSNGPAPAVGVNSLSQGGPPAGGLHSSGGSTGPHSYKTVSGSNLARSRTHGRIGGVSNQNKSNILARIKCPCLLEAAIQLQNGHMRAHKGKKQPILHSSENTANCGHCGQFYAIKVSTFFHHRFAAFFCHFQLTNNFYRILNTHIFRLQEESRSLLEHSLAANHP